MLNNSMKLLKNYILPLIILPLAAFADLSFDSSRYTLGFEASVNGVVLNEYYSGERSEKWTTMVSLQKHDGRAEAIPVIQEYMAQRASILASEPNVSSRDGAEAAEYLIDFVIGDPEKTPHAEYVIARFTEHPGSNPSVTVLVYSHKIEFNMTDEEMEQVFKDINTKRLGWLTELSEIGLTSLKKTATGK